MKKKEKLNIKKTLTSRKKGAVIWFTGLPSSGKSTLADKLALELIKRKRQVERLDGDVFRDFFKNKLGFSKDDRDFNIDIASCVCSLLEKNSVVVIASFVSPYLSHREKVRNTSSDFVEVFVDTPLEKCIERDVKGLYKKAIKGEIKEFTGISDPYEIPHNPEIVVKTENKSIKKCVQEIILYLESKKYI